MSENNGKNVMIYDDEGLIESDSFKQFWIVFFAVLLANTVGWIINKLFTLAFMNAAFKSMSM